MQTMIKIPEITEAVAIWRAGGLVAFPTETVYGLGADASNEVAIRRIFAAKGRPHDHPLIVHVANVRQLQDWARDVPAEAYLLANLFWPGPLTLILKKQPHVLDLVTGGQETVGIRIPNHPIALALLEAFNGGIVAPSANQFTHISPTTAQAVHEELGDKVDLIIDGGACDVGLESTILDMTGPVPRILRPGMITAEAITAALGSVVSVTRKEVPGIRAPGMHHLHYAPTTKTILLHSAQLPAYLKMINQRVAVVTYSQMTLPINTFITHIQMPTTPIQYAHDLYRVLRELDHQQFHQIIIEAVPETSEWAAIRDRLFRASGSV